VRITKEKQIADRRQLVLELRARGLSQTEIAGRLPTVVDQKTVMT
jgi:transcriptional regulator